MDRETVGRLWEAHKQEQWPRLASHIEGPLMTLDTVISGCVVYFLDSDEGLDEQRRAIVGDCLADGSPVPEGAIERDRERHRGVAVIAGHADHAIDDLTQLRRVIVAVAGIEHHDASRRCGGLHHHF